MKNLGQRINPTSLPYTLILILVGALLIVSLLPELRTAITGASNITGAGATLLGYLPFILVAGVTLVIVYTFLGGSRTRMLKLAYDFKRHPFLASMKMLIPKTSLTTKIAILGIGASRGISVGGAIPLIVGLVIAFIIGIEILEQLAYEIDNATGAGGDLAGTLEATLLNLWIVIIIAGVLIGTLVVFMSGSFGGGRRGFRKGKGRGG